MKGGDPWNPSGKKSTVIVQQAVMQYINAPTAEKCTAMGLIKM